MAGESAVTTQAAPAAPASTSPSDAGVVNPGSSVVAPQEDYKSKYTELESKYKTADEDARAFNQVRQIIAKNPELKEHLEAAYYGRPWQPKVSEPVAQPKPNEPAPAVLPKEIQDKLAGLDQMNTVVQQMQEQQAVQVESAKLDREMQETQAQYPFTKDPKFAGQLTERFNARVMEVARGIRQRDRFSPDETVVQSALAQVSNVPYRTLLWDLMEKEMAQNVAELTFKGVRGMQNPGGRGDRVVSQPAGQSPDADAQFESEMKAASSGKNVDHGKRAEALMRRGITPRDLGWPD
jgi:hypothetical protein